MVKKLSLLLAILMVVVSCSCADKNKSSTNDDPFEGWSSISIVTSKSNISSDPDLNSYNDCKRIVDKAASVMLCELKGIEVKTPSRDVGGGAQYYILELLPVKQYKGELPEEPITVYHQGYAGNYYRTLTSVNEAARFQYQNTLCIVALREVSSPYYNGKYDIIAFMPCVNGTINRAEVAENSNPEVYPKKYYIFDVHSQIFQNINTAVIDSPENGDPYLYNYWKTTNLEKIVKISTNIIKIRVTDRTCYDSYFKNRLVACEVLKSFKGGPHGYKNKWVYIRFKEGDIVPGNEYIVCLDRIDYSIIQNDFLLKGDTISEQYQHMYTYSATKSVFDVSQEKEIKKLIKSSAN